MDISRLGNITKDVLKKEYFEYLHGNTNYKEGTINRKVSNAFYIWRHYSQETFYKIYTIKNDKEFETTAYDCLYKSMQKKSNVEDIEGEAREYLANLNLYRDYLKNTYTLK